MGASDLLMGLLMKVFLAKIVRMSRRDCTKVRVKDLVDVADGVSDDIVITFLELFKYYILSQS